jgi:adenylosuccinate synthase
MQFGSTGKGLLIGAIEESANQGSIAVSTMAPNAGHTYVDPDGKAFVHSAVPLGALFPNIDVIGIGPGSTVDLDKMVKELENASLHRYGRNTTSIVEPLVLIHAHAGVLTGDMVKEDARHVAIGSTMKGSGSAQIAKIRRDPTGDACLIKHVEPSVPDHVGCFHVKVVDHHRWLVLMDEFIRGSHGEIVIEGSQGYSLGLTSGMWPYTTYRECTPAQILADAALPIPLSDVRLMGVLRTYPIRVANRFNEEGEQIGTSGPCYPDQAETSWEKIGVPPEFTTVTKLERRVFSFSLKQFKQAMLHTRPDTILCNFMNYLSPKDQEAFKDMIQSNLTHLVELLWGYGPATEDIEHGGHHG